MKRRRAIVRFADESKISEHLFCSICKEVFQIPERLNCGSFNKNKKQLILFFNLVIHFVTPASVFGSPKKVYVPNVVSRRKKSIFNLI